MSTQKVNLGAKKIEIEAVIIRADGTVENLGTISYWHKSWFMRIWHKVKQLFKKKKG